MSARQLERCRFIVASQKAFVETMLGGCSIVITKPGVKVITIEPFRDDLSTESVAKPFSMAFKQVCRLHEVVKLVSSPVESYHCLGSIDSLLHHPREMKVRQNLRLLCSKTCRMSVEGEIMNVLEAIKGRRSTRAFKNRNGSVEIIEKLIDAARWAPSAGNIQPWEFIIV
jgi:hypothetical protein